MNQTVEEYRRAAQALHEAADRSDERSKRETLMALAAYQEKLAYVEENTQRVDH